MLPEGLLSYPHEDYRNNLSNIFHSAGLVLHKNCIDFLSVARRFEGISSLLYNMIPPSFDHDRAYMVDQNHELKSLQSENRRLFYFQRLFKHLYYL